MKLSDTKNPRTGQPFTMEQMKKGAAHHGLTWKADNEADPTLSSVLVQAVEELGWSDPNATLRRAVKLQDERPAEAGVRWYGGVVWVDGNVRSDLSAAQLAKLTGAVGDGFSGSIADPDTAAVEGCKWQPVVGEAKTQCWDDAASDKPCYH